MKFIPLIFIMGFTMSTFGQKEQLLISNSKNFEFSPFTDVEIKGDTVHYSFTMYIKEIALAKYSSTVNEKLKFDSLTTAIEFVSLDNGYQYYYPINKLTFNQHDLQERTQNYHSKNCKIRLDGILYRSNPNPIVVIQSLEIIK
ncbi:hypothetical protein ACNKXS_14345 [Christiangramia marina]|uniref:hypothetical protein n=1 Tax=Christiangramia marina TaxID=409436 RepID=UPI003AA8A300